jgi:hypothetical protein
MPLKGEVFRDLTGIYPLKQKKGGFARSRLAVSNPFPE